MMMRQNTVHSKRMQMIKGVQAYQMLNDLQQRGSNEANALCMQIQKANEGRNRRQQLDQGSRHARSRTRNESSTPLREIEINIVNEVGSRTTWKKRRASRGDQMQMNQMSDDQKEGNLQPLYTATEDKEIERLKKLEEEKAKLSKINEELVKVRAERAERRMREEEQTKEEAIMIKLEELFLNEQEQAHIQSDEYLVNFDLSYLKKHIHSHFSGLAPDSDDFLEQYGNLYFKAINEEYARREEETNKDHKKKDHFIRSTDEEWSKTREEEYNKEKQEKIEVEKREEETEKREETERIRLRQEEEQEKREEEQQKREESERMRQEEQHKREEEEHKRKETERIRIEELKEKRLRQLEERERMRQEEQHKREEEQHKREETERMREEEENKKDEQILYKLEELASEFFQGFFETTEHLANFDLSYLKNHIHSFRGLALDGDDFLVQFQNLIIEAIEEEHVRIEEETKKNSEQQIQKELDAIHTSQEEGRKRIEQKWNKEKTLREEWDTKREEEFQKKGEATAINYCYEEQSKSREEQWNKEKSRWEEQQKTEETERLREEEQILKKLEELLLSEQGQIECDENFQDFNLSYLKKHIDFFRGLDPDSDDFQKQYGKVIDDFLDHIE